MVLVRHHLGGVLRRIRMRQGRTLRQVAADARMSLGYLSEIERGQKEASSELLSAISDSLDVPLSEVLREVSEQLMIVESVETPDTIEAVEAAELVGAVDSVDVSATPHPTRLPGRRPYVAHRPGQPLTRKAGHPTTENRVAA